MTFEVLEEGDEEAGDPARVARRGSTSSAWEAQREELPEEPAERVRAIVARVVLALDLRASVDIEEDDEEIRATVNGDDLGLLIGRHGQTIDALQHLASAGRVPEREDRKRVVVDAAGYRERREAALHRSADRAVDDALSFGRPGRARADERLRAADRPHVPARQTRTCETHSEGDEPERRLVVTPVRAQRVAIAEKRSAERERALMKNASWPRSAR